MDGFWIGVRDRVSAEVRAGLVQVSAGLGLRVG